MWFKSIRFDMATLTASSSLSVCFFHFHIQLIVCEKNKHSASHSGPRISFFFFHKLYRHRCLNYDQARTLLLGCMNADQVRIFSKKKNPHSKVRVSYFWIFYNYNSISIFSAQRPKWLLCLSGVKIILWWPEIAYIYIKRPQIQNLSRPCQILPPVIIMQWVNI